MVFGEAPSRNSLNDRSQRDPAPGNVEIALPLLDVFSRHRNRPFLILATTRASGAGQHPEPNTAEQSAAKHDVILLNFHVCRLE
jgi:hypothetical protein